ncbi:unnamed protein product [Taenia asiatica]|uniref:CAP-ZIP_m domain-containing protein n=1 Tax=Taenia asiatica TaxID=60517 RepID=A0A0R3W1P7_TAEAS|nr:unnamed protein product [Taenia asiatica]
MNWLRWAPTRLSLATVEVLGPAKVCISRQKRINESVKAGPIPVENCAKLPEDDGCYANPPPSSVEIVAEVNASVERNDPPSSSEFGQNSDADVMKPTGHSVGDPTTTAKDWNEIKEDILDDYANPCEVSGTEVNAMTTNVTQSGRARATDTDDFDDGRGNFPEVNQTCEPELSHEENPTPKYAAESPSSSPIEHFGEPSTVNTRESDVAKENSPEAFLSSEAKPHSGLSSAPNLTTQFAPPPTTNTREHDVDKEDFPKADLHPTAKTSANVIYTTPQISSAVPASTDNHKVTTSVKSSESESKSKPQSDRDDCNNEQLSFADRKKLFDDKDSASCLQSTNRAVKTPLTGSAKSMHQSSVVQPSVDEKSKKVNKSASSSATAASSSSFSPKRSPGNCKSVNKKDDNDSDSDSDDDDDDDDDSSSDSEPTTLSDDAKKEGDSGRLTRF